MATKTSDTEAMNQIHQILDAQEWDADTADKIAEIVRDTGREVRDCDPDAWDD